MRRIVVLGVLGILFTLPVWGQNPVSWNFSSKKISDNTYEVRFTASIAKPWHLYSQHTPDGGPVATQFSFSKNPLVQLEEKTIETGKVITRFEDVFGVDVKYFDGQAEFTQKIKVRGGAKTNLAGSVEYMVCNDVQCLPPTTVPFNIALK